MIASSISKASKVISEDFWQTFTKGPTIIDKSASKSNPNKNLFSNKSWELAEYLEQAFPKFTGLTTSLTNKLRQWEAYIEARKLTAPLP